MEKVGGKKRKEKKSEKGREMTTGKKGRWCEKAVERKR